MQPPTLRDWLLSVEWYDNHKLSTWLDCRRKYYWNSEFRGKGLSGKVGHQADFGTCFHAALAAYYHLWDSASEDTRRLAAFRAFSRSYYRLFAPSVEKQYDSPYTEERGHQILDSYCNAYLQEDRDFRPIDNELTMIIPIKPRDYGTDADPYIFMMRVDGLWEARRTRDWWVLETKATKTVDHYCKIVAHGRQATGYVWGARQFKGGEKVKGVIPNIIGVMKEKYSFKRDFVEKSKSEEESWLLQTIRIVEEIRAARREFAASGDLNIYIESTNRCDEYGGCPFLDLHTFGPALASTHEPNSWTPLDV